jgi:signal peptidase II
VADAPTLRVLDPPSARMIAVLVAAAGWIADQATKTLALDALEGGRRIELPGPLYLELTFNPGAAFGLPIPWWAILGITVIVLVLVFRWVSRTASLLEPLALGLLAAGALGNVTDRLLRPHPDGAGRGEVVDFIGSTFWPTFNFADIWITVGFGLFVVAAWQQAHEEARDGDEEPYASERAAERT